MKILWNVLTLCNQVTSLDFGVGLAETMQSK